MRSFEQDGSDVLNTEEYWEQLMQLADKMPRENEDDAEAERTDDAGGPSRAELSAIGNKAAVSVIKQDEVMQAEPEARQELDAWLETMEGSPEEYWHKLEDKWWFDEEAPLDQYAMPKLDVLMNEASKMLREQVPGLSDEGVRTRAEMATKIVLQDLAKREAEMLIATKDKLDRKGNRKLDKGWDEKLLHRAFYEMRNHLTNFYKSYDWVKEGVVGDDLTENEQIAWRTVVEPQKPGTLNMRILLGKYPRREEEGADEYFARLKNYTRQDKTREDQLAADAKYEAEHPRPVVEPAKKQEAEKSAEEQETIHKLRPDEAEIVEEPKLIVPADIVMNTQSATVVETALERHENVVRRVWNKVRGVWPFMRRREEAVVDAGTAMVPRVDVAEIVTSEEDVVVAQPEDNVEQMDDEAAVGQTIGMVERAMRILEKQASVLEDYDPLKSEMTQQLDELKVTLANLQALWLAGKDDIEDGKRQKELGLKLDETEEGDSDIWRKGALAMEGFYASGILKREQSVEEKLETVQNFQNECNKGLRDAMSAIRYLRWQAQKEEDAQRHEEDGGVIVQFPSRETLQNLRS